MFVGCRCEGYVYGYGLELFGMGIEVSVPDSFLQKEGHLLIRFRKIIVAAPLIAIPIKIP